LAIEWPIEDFVSEGDFVLTTGTGCNEEQLAGMVTEVSVAGGAVFCIATGPGAFHQYVTSAVVEAATESSITLIELPWRVRFSDVSRAIIQLLNRWPAPASDSAFPHAFAKALLGPSGIAGVAQALEEVISAPVVIFDAGLTIAGAGPRGMQWSDQAGNESRLVSFLARLFRQGRDGSGQDHVPAEQSLDDPSVLHAVPALVHDGIVGWVVSNASQGSISDSNAMRQAATAAAIELVRRVTDDEAAFQARDALLWDIVSGAASSEFEIATRAALVGLSPSADLRVAIGLVEQAATASGVLSTRATVNMIQRRLSHPFSVAALREHEILVCRHSSESASLETLASYLPPNSVTISWGEAMGVHRLFGLRAAAAQARTALGVQRALSGQGTIGPAEALGPYMLLSHLVRNEEAVELVRRTMVPLEDADEAKNSDLIGTLQIFLACHGNISQAARELYLNRHSLIYRLRRISEITGLDLESYEDRSLLDMALRIRRLRPANDQE
jgi:purine catabolism regulator